MSLRLKLAEIGHRFDHAPDDERIWALERRFLFPWTRKYRPFTVASIAAPMQTGYPEVFDDLRNGLLLPSSALALLGAEMEKTRVEIGELINAPIDRIYLMDNTSRAMEEGLRMLRLEDGELITTDREYDSIVSIMEQSGLDLVVVPPGRDFERRVIDSVTPRTRGILMSHVTHDTCEQLPVEGISKIARDFDLPFLLDAAQSIGQIPVDVATIKPTVLAGCGHKWLCGETISGILYLDRRVDATYLSDASPWTTSVYERSSSILPGETMTREQAFFDMDSYGCASGALHLGKVLRHWDAIGWDSIYDRVAYLGSYLRESLSTNPDVEVLAVGKSAPAMVAFRVHGTEQQIVASRLEMDYGIQVVHKHELNVLRASCFACNSMQEIDYLNRTLSEIRHEPR